MMRLQRAGVAESPAECSSLNGPLRARSKAIAEYSATRGLASVAGGMSVPRRACDVSQIKVAPRIGLFVLDR